MSIYRRKLTRDDRAVIASVRLKYTLFFLVSLLYGMVCGYMIGANNKTMFRQDYETVSVQLDSSRCIEMLGLASRGYVTCKGHEDILDNQKLIYCDCNLVLSMPIK